MEQSYTPNSFNNLFGVFPVLAEAYNNIVVLPKSLCQVLGDGLNAPFVGMIVFRYVQQRLLHHVCLFAPCHPWQMWLGCKISKKFVMCVVFGRKKALATSKSRAQAGRGSSIVSIVGLISDFPSYGRCSKYSSRCTIEAADEEFRFSLENGQHLFLVVTLDGLHDEVPCLYQATEEDESLW